MLPRYPMLYHPQLKKQGQHKAELKPIWTFFCDGGGIEEGTFKFHEEQKLQSLLAAAGLSCSVTVPMAHI